MFDRVSQKNLCRIETCLFESAAQQLTCRSDERLAGEIFLIARLLADQHQPRVHRAFPEYRLCGAFIEIAAAAVLGCVAGPRQCSF